MTRQDKIRHDKTRQDNKRQDKTRQDKTRHKKTREAITCLVGVLPLTLAPRAYHDFADICVGVYEQIRSHPPTEISAKT